MTKFTPLSRLMMALTHVRLVTPKATCRCLVSFAACTLDQR